VNGWTEAAWLLESEWVRLGGVLAGFASALRWGPRFGRWLAGLATANYRLALKVRDCEALTESLTRSLAELDRLRAAPTSSRTGRAPRGLSD
jgi:hypothetical protein